MEKDPHIVAGLAAEREEDHWRFRSRLKVLRLRRITEINARAEQLGLAAEAQMDCRTCAACCRNNWIPLDAEEVERLSARLQIAPDTFRERYVRHDEGEDGIDARPCPFLEGNLCSVYDVRPDACRGYPYVGGDIPSRMLGIIERAGTCPIVFEMLEGLRHGAT